MKPPSGTRPVRTGTALVAGLLAVVIAAGCGSSGSSDSGGGHETSTPRHTHQGAVALTAEYLQVKPSAVRRELREGKTLAEIANASPGHSAKGLLEFAVRTRRAELEAQAQKQGLSSEAVESRLEGVRQRLEQRFTRASIAVVATAYGAAADYLALSPLALHEKRAEGKSLAVIANSTPGHSEKGLIEAILKAEQKALGLVGAGSPPASSRARIEETVKRLVNRVPPRQSASAAGSPGG